jgi:trk system potassium uptake protein TrkA
VARCAARARRHTGELLRSTGAGQGRPGHHRAPVHRVYVRALYGRVFRTRVRPHGRQGNQRTGGVDHVHVVVMGCGRVGSAIARRLEGIGHSVAVIDQDPEAFRRLGPEFAGRQVTGLGFDRQTLLAAGIDSAGAFAAVSSGDNSNIISARVARETFGVEHVVARIYDSKRAEVYERMGIPSVATVPWTVNRLMRELLSVKVSELWREPTGKVLLMRVTVTDGWVGRPLAELEAATGARASWMVRFGEAQLPTPSTVLQTGDHLVVAVTDELTDRVHKVVENPPEGRH